MPWDGLTAATCVLRASRIDESRGRVNSMTDKQALESARRILLVEDSADDAELVAFALRKMPFAFSIDRVETAEDFNARLDSSPPDVVLCDYHFPRFSMREALRIVREERALDIPFIGVSRPIPHDAADTPPHTLPNA